MTLVSALCLLAQVPPVMSRIHVQVSDAGTFDTVRYPNRLRFKDVGAVIDGSISPIKDITGGRDIEAKISGHIDFVDESFTIKMNVKGGPTLSIPPGSNEKDAFIYLSAVGLYFEIVKPSKWSPKLPLMIRFLGSLLQRAWTMLNTAVTAL